MGGLHIPSLGRTLPEGRKAAAGMVTIAGVAPRLDACWRFGSACYQRVSIRIKDTRFAVRLAVDALACLSLKYWFLSCLFVHGLPPLFADEAIPRNPTDTVSRWTKIIVIDESLEWPKVLKSSSSTWTRFFTRSWVAKSSSSARITWERVGYTGISYL